MSLRYAPREPAQKKTGLPGFEPGFEAPEAAVLSKLYYRPYGQYVRLARI